MRGSPTPAWNHGNSSTGEHGTDIAFVVAHSLILLMTSVAGIAANVFVLLAVYHQKSLQTPNNALVVNLAIIDLLRCAIDCPVLLTIVTTVYHTGHVDATICETQVASFSFSCCIQLLTLACISAERYQAVAQPFKKSQRKKRVMVLIPAIWVLASVVTVFSFLFAKDSLVHVRCRGSQRGTLSFHDTFGLYMLLPLWAACFSVITAFYARIFTLVRSHNRKIFDKGISLVPKRDPTVNESTTEEITAVRRAHGNGEQTQAMSGLVAQVDELKSTKKNSSPAPLTREKTPRCVSTSPKRTEQNKTVSIVDLETEQPQYYAVQTEGFSAWVTEVEARPSDEGDVAMEPQKVSNNLDTENGSKKGSPETQDVGRHRRAPTQRENPDSTSQATNGNKGATSAVTTPHQPPFSAPVSDNDAETEATKQTAAAEGAVCMMPSKARGERVNKRRESKMAKRAGYIILTFLVLWLPLITTILVNFAVYKMGNAQIKILQDMEILSVSVACVTSLSDPMTYAAVNPQFRTEYRRIKARVKNTFSKE